MWSNTRKILQRISDWEFEVEDLETKEKVRHHVKNLRILNRNDLVIESLSNEGLVLWSALTQHDISRSSKFKLEDNKQFCKSHFN